VSAASDYPNRRNVASAIDVVYRTVLNKIRADLHRASAFSLTFDGWTARGLRNAYIAILYSWIDDSFEVIGFFVLFFFVSEAISNCSIVRSYSMLRIWAIADTMRSPWRC
jgi:hypothetical protein